MGLQVPKTLYEQFLESKPLFSSNEEALLAYEGRMKDIATKHCLSVDEFWVQAEQSSHLSEDEERFLGLVRAVSILKYLRSKSND